ncbi:Ig-like domain-containing protein [Hymenobacter sp. ASUV-10]|uniref:Ig-like domain-containing protein n=1 Tax=Hymenobacter aranciens TaxID=3063996 RepID=A0ABT9BAI7_9BACT|nr:Ig-like domain-containing protein [Hymenobacter sp. ASUV-10]MDO7875287.1 Ig-like domain-containing protein [Hymenobacter sp. ASUV-10]
MRNPLHLLALLVLLLIGRPVWASTPPTAGRPLAEALNADGTLKPGMAGSFDPKGYELVDVAGSRQPQFRPVSAKRTQGAGDEKWRNGFDLPGTNGIIRAMVRVGSVLYLGGDFTIAGNVVANRIARWDGTAWGTLGTGFNGTVHALAVGSTGNLYAGGEFTTAGGTAANRIASWNGTAWSTLGSGVDGPVYAVASSGGTLYAGGSFATAGGTAASQIASWNGTTWNSLGTGMNGSVRALAVNSSGLLYAGGEFTTAGGATANRIASWNGTTWSTLGSGFSYYNDPLCSIYTLAVTSNGTLYAGGFFSTAGGTTAAAIASWNGTSWSALGNASGVVYALTVDGNNNVYVGGAGFSTGLSSGFNASAQVGRWNGTSWSLRGGNALNDIKALALDASGNLYAGGEMRSIQNPYSDRNIYLPFLARWNGTTWGPVGPGVSSQVRMMVLDGTGGVYIGGEFTTVGGIAASHVARWNGTAWSALGLGVNDDVVGMALDASGNLYVGGRFTEAGGSPAYCIARWNGSTWSEVGTGLAGTVATILIAGNTIYAGGSFTMANGASANHVARWDGTSWSALGLGYTNGTNAPILALAMDNSGNLYAGGEFTTAGGQTANRVARWNGRAWSALGSGVNNFVNALLFDASNNLYVAGGFTTAGSAPANRIARWNGTTWSTLGTGLNNGATDLRFDSAGNLYVVGGFTTAGGVPANRIARWNGTTWSAVAGTGTNEIIYALQLNGSNGLYVGGRFTAVGDGSKAMAFFGAYDFNAVAPTIAAQAFTLPENSANGTAVGTVQATGSSLSYSLTAGNTGGAFAINSSTGALTVANAAALDYETTPSFALTVQVTDGTTPATATITVNLTDVDDTRPTVSISSSAGANNGSTSTTPLPFTVTFSESVTGFGQGDVTVTGGSIVPGSLTVLSPSTYTIQVTPTSSGSPVTVNVAANVAQDAAGNGNTAATPFSITYAQPQTAAPVVTAPAHVSLSNDNTPTYEGTAPASSTVTVRVDGAAIGNTTATAGGTWSLTQPTALADGTHTVNATAQTSGELVSPVSNTNGFTIDTAAPTVTLSSGTASGGTTTTSPLSFTATFSESVTGLAAGHITVTNGTVTSGPTGSGTTYTFQVTPTTPGTATTVSIAANVVQDAAGNGNTAAATYSLTYLVTSVTWNGNTSTNWFTAANWTPALVPTATLNATIPNGRPNSPAITAGTASVRNLTINSGATLTQGTGTLNVAGNVTNNGTFAPTGGTVGLGGTTLSNMLGSSRVRFWNLTVGANGAQVSTSAGTSVRRLLTLTANLTTNGNDFVLESDAAVTGLVYNNGGVISGNVTVQRYIAPTTNAGAGYRHYSAPVSTATVGSLATAGFTPVVNPAYNSLAQPGFAAPFPTVYGYDQSRLSLTNDLDFFSKGWVSPASLGDQLTVGQGYSVNISGGQTLAVTGPQNNGTYTQTLARGPVRGTPDQAGWQLVGNPYPAPLNYAQVTAADRPNLDGTMYVYASSGPYTGTYGFYNNGIGNISPIIAQSQGFFMRVSTGQTSGSLTFRNAQRVTSYTNPTYQRTNTTRPLVQLDLQGANAADPLYVYFEQGATAGPDAEFDAVKLANPSGLNLSAVAGNVEMAIDALPLPGATAVTVPLQVRVPATGTYTLHAASIVNLPAGMVAYLRDRQTGTVQDLSQQPDYSFAFNAAYTGVRFELFFTPQRVTAVAPASLSAQVAVFPNPAHKAVFVELPATLSRAAVTVTLVDALGRTVLTQPLTGASTQLALDGVAAGVYALRLQTAQGTITKKLTVE